MNKYLRYFGYLVTLVFLFVGTVIVYVKEELPDVGDAEDVQVERTPERLLRGEYLANNVCVCMDCHSTRDWTKFSGPLSEGTLGKGGEIFDQNFGFPGKFYSANITPAGIGNWTDGELLRAIASGVNKEGRALFPVMPHANYGRMDREDLLSIIAYVRNLKAIENKVPASVPDFPMNVIINTIPKKAEYSHVPDKNNALAYGAYLFNAAACGDCHTQQVKGEKVMELELAGGFEFPLGNGTIVRSTNITPDKETGIGNWSEEVFVSRFRKYADSTYHSHTVEKGTFNTVMPWTMYGKMKEEDLKAIYAYLKTVKPIKNEVVKFSGS